MKRVILTIGPQYAGKSTFSKKVAAADPRVRIISRDEILISMFGKVWLDPYSGRHYEALAVMWENVQEYLSSDEAQERILILDAWNGPHHERSSIVRQLQQLGADRIDGWHFVTPLDTCIEWSFLRDPIVEHDARLLEKRRRWRSEDYSRIHRMFCDLDVESESIFDSVRRINPLDPIPDDLLAL